MVPGSTGGWGGRVTGAGGACRTGGDCAKAGALASRIAPATQRGNLPGNRIRRALIRLATPISSPEPRLLLAPVVTVLSARRRLHNSARGSVQKLWLKGALIRLWN